MKLYLCGKPGQNYGWGTCLTNLAKHLAPLCDLELVEKPPANKLPGPALIPIADYKLNPIFEVTAEKLIGYCFTEAPLDADSVRNASRYDLIFAGSTWNADRLRSAIKNQNSKIKILLQGVDHSLFTPQPPTQRKGFVVFSGGKYEYRKGQDYVIAAMKHFMAVRKDAVLITAWHNHWKASELSMQSSWLLEDPSNPFAALSPDRVIALPLVSHAALAKVYAESHIGLFPNRCEAGTNLVMMEYMACSRPVIATYATGQRDVLGPSGPCSPYGPYLLTTGTYDPAGWFNPEVSDIIAALEHAYTHREGLAARGQDCAKLIAPLTWPACAQQIVSAAFEEDHPAPAPVQSPDSQQPVLSPP